MKLENKIGGLVEIDWANDLHELQPDNVKVPINLNYLKESILTHGFALPFAVWNDNGKYFCIDGHTRKQVLTELIADGIDVPTKLKAFEILAKDRQEAIKILVEVYNQKHNPFAEEVLTEWLEVEEIEVESLVGVNVLFAGGMLNNDEVGLSDEFSENFSLKDGDKEPFQQMTFSLADEQAEVIKGVIKEAIQTEEFKYIETFGNENKNANALYLIIQQWAEQRKS